MTDRITRETVTFSYPFELADVEGKQLAGTYTIETIAYRRVSTTIVLASEKEVRRAFETR